MARELELEYQSIAMSTDYDCWHESKDEVTMEMIYAVMEKNVEKRKKIDWASNTVNSRKQQIEGINEY